MLALCFAIIVLFIGEKKRGRQKLTKLQHLSKLSHLFVCRSLCWYWVFCVQQQGWEQPGVWGHLPLQHFYCAVSGSLSGWQEGKVGRGAREMGLCEDSLSEMDCTWDHLVWRCPACWVLLAVSYKSIHMVCLREWRDHVHERMFLGQWESYSWYRDCKD